MDNAKTHHILIVDDGPTNRLLMRSLFDRFGYSITEAGTGVEALDACSAQSFDLILMDLHMPEMNGIECCRTLREQNIDSPIILVSAEHRTELLREAMTAGFTYAIAKPLKAEDIDGLVQNYLLDQNKQERSATDLSSLPIIDSSVLDQLSQSTSWQNLENILLAFITEGRLLIERIDDSLHNVHISDESSHAIGELASNAAYVGAQRLAQSCKQLSGCLYSASHQTKLIEQLKGIFQLTCAELQHYLANSKCE